MARYIAIPRKRPAKPDPDSSAVGYSVKKRANRIASLRSSRLRNRELQLSESLVAKYELSSTRKLLATPQRQTPLTGVTIIEGDAQDAEELQNELPDHEVIEDFDLFLVEPTPEAGPPPQEDNLDLWHLGAIALDKARNSGFQGVGQGIGVAVLDTGIAQVDELDGRIKDAFELDVNMKPVKIDTHDTHGHGTGVAALIAGKTVGVAPGVDLYNFITIPNRRGSYSNFVLATEFIAGQSGVAIANISAGVRGWDPRIMPGIEALLEAYILPVVAVGNEGSETSRSPGNYSNVLSVGATNKRGRIWSGSGSEEIHKVPPPYQVPNLVGPGARVTTCNGDGVFRVYNGSSLATPIVSGIAALILEQYEDITDTELREAIFGACLKLEHAEAERQGNGQVQLPSDMWFTGV